MTKEERDIYNRNYYKNHKEEILAKKKEYRKNHKEEISAYKKEYRENHKEEISAYNKEYNKNHKKEISAKAKKYRKNHKKEISAKAKEYQKNHKKEISAKAKEYQKNHKEEISVYLKKYQKEYQKNHKEKILAKKKKRLENDIQYKLAAYLRSRQWNALKGNYKTGSAIRDLGCSIAYLKIHLENQFQSGMTWKNWGKEKGQWSLDHIIPLSSVDLTDRNQFLKVCHYTNLRPMWHIENIRKGKKTT